VKEAAGGGPAGGAPPASDVANGVRGAAGAGGGGPAGGAPPAGQVGGDGDGDAGPAGAGGPGGGAFPAGAPGGEAAGGNHHGARGGAAMHRKRRGPAFYHERGNDSLHSGTTATVFQACYALLKLKIEYSIHDTAFDLILGVISEILPAGHIFPGYDTFHAP